MIPSSASFRLSGFHCEAQQCAFSTGRLVSLRRGTGIDQVEVQVRLFVDLRHFAAHPARVPATKGRLEVRGHEFVELTYFEYRLVGRRFVFAPRGEATARRQSEIVICL